MGFELYEETKFYTDLFYVSGPGAAMTTLDYNDTKRYSRVDGISIQNPDSIDHTFTFGISSPTSSSIIGEVVVPAGSGVGLLPPFDALAVIAPPTVIPIRFQPEQFLSIVSVEAIVDSVGLSVIVSRGEF